MRKKKICIDISNIIPGKGGSGGGIATYALNLVRGLNQTNSSNDLEICCIKHPDFNEFDNCNNIKIINARIRNKKILHRFFWTHIYLPFFCIRNKIHLLHRVTPELPLIKVCKYVCTLHDLMFDFYLSHKEIKRFLKKSDLIKFRFFRIIAKHATVRSDSIIVPSYSIKNELTENYKTNSKKITVIYEAAEKGDGGIKTALKENFKKLHIGVIAGFYPHKGHRKVMEMAHKFIQHGFTDFKISFRGNPAFPNYIHEILSLKETLGLNDHIFLVAYDQKAQLQQIYSEFDLILLLSEYEGFGLPVLEAQAHNLPVFCSDIPVFKEILENSAYYISDDLNDTLIKKIIKDLKDIMLLDSIISMGISNLEKYSWEKMSIETSYLYKKTLGD